MKVFYFHGIQAGFNYKFATYPYISEISHALNSTQ